MCIATPVKVKKLNKNIATVYAQGITKKVDISLLKNIRSGDYLYISNNLGIRKIPRKDAKKVLDLIRTWNK